MHSVIYQIPWIHGIQRISLPFKENSNEGLFAESPIEMLWSLVKKSEVRSFSDSVVGRKEL